LAPFVGSTAAAISALGQGLRILVDPDILSLGHRGGGQSGRRHDGGRLLGQGLGGPFAQPDAFTFERCLVVGFDELDEFIQIVVAECLALADGKISAQQGRGDGDGGKR